MGHDYQSSSIFSVEDSIIYENKIITKKEKIEKRITKITIINNKKKIITASGIIINMKNKSNDFYLIVTARHSFLKNDIINPPNIKECYLIDFDKVEIFIDSKHFIMDLDFNVNLFLNKKYDIALIYIEKNIIEINKIKIEKLDLITVPSLDFILNDNENLKDVMLYCYKKDEKILYKSNCFRDGSVSFSDDLGDTEKSCEFTHFANTDKGSSGGPIIFEKEQIYFFLGIHIQKSFIKIDIKFNIKIAIKFNIKIINWMKNIYLEIPNEINFNLLINKLNSEIIINKNTPKLRNNYNIEFFEKENKVKKLDLIRKKKEIKAFDKIDNIEKNNKIDNEKVNVINTDNNNNEKNNIIDNIDIEIDFDKINNIDNEIDMIDKNLEAITEITSLKTLATIKKLFDLKNEEEFEKLKNLVNFSESIYDYVDEKEIELKSEMKNEGKYEKNDKNSFISYNKSDDLEIENKEKDNVINITSNEKIANNEKITYNEKIIKRTNATMKNENLEINTEFTNSLKSMAKSIKSEMINSKNNNNCEDFVIFNNKLSKKNGIEKLICKIKIIDKKNNCIKIASGIILKTEKNNYAIVTARNSFLKKILVKNSKINENDYLEIEKIELLINSQNITVFIKKNINLILHDTFDIALIFLSNEENLDKLQIIDLNIKIDCKNNAHIEKIKNFKDVCLYYFKKDDDLLFKYHCFKNLKKFQNNMHSLEKNYEFIHFASIDKGSSGGPIIYEKKNEYFFIGMHIEKIKGDLKARKGIKFNEEIKNWIQSKFKIALKK